MDCSSDGNAGVVSPRQPTLLSSPIPPPPPPAQSAGQGRLEEKNDRISKEKQKFFRLSAFNAKHQKLKKRVGGGDDDPKSKSTIKVPHARSLTRATFDSTKKSKPASSSSSSGASSNSSSDESNNSSDSSDDDEDDEDNSSEGSSSSSDEPQKVVANSATKPAPSAGSASTGPFSCELHEDKPWGFAAAAASANPNSPFFSSVTSTFGASLPKLQVGHKPTFGLHIRPPEEKKKPPAKSPGVGQLKGLFDGLSHFFCAPGSSRVKPGAPLPNYAPDRRKRQVAEEPKLPTSRQSKIELNQKKQRELMLERQRQRDKERDEREKEKKRPAIEKPPRMTPSGLVKTAVNSKRHEHDRRRLAKNLDDVPLIKFAQSRSTVRSHPEHQPSEPIPKSNPRTCISATTTNTTTTTPRATPCSTRKGKSSTPPHHDILLTQRHLTNLHPVANRHTPL